MRGWRCGTEDVLFELNAAYTHQEVIHLISSEMMNNGAKPSPIDELCSNN